MLPFLANTQNIDTQYWRDLNILHTILQETLIPSAWTKLQKIVLFTAEFFSSVLLDSLYCWRFWRVTSIAVAGEGAAHHLLLGWCYSGSSFYRRGRKFSILCHLSFRCTEAFLTDCLLLLMKEICLVTALYAQLIKTTYITRYVSCLLGRNCLHFDRFISCGY